jgi:hypothetical protein
VISNFFIIVDLQPITKGHRRFLAIMVAIFGVFKAEVSGIAAKNLPDLPQDGLSRPDPANGIAEKTKIAYQRGKASRRSRLRRGGYATRTCFFKHEVESA